MSELIIPTDRYLLKDLRLSHEAQLLKVVQSTGPEGDFFYPYIQGNLATLDLSEEQCVHKYAQLSEDCNTAEDRKTYIMGIFDKNTDDLVGVTVLVEVEANDPMFLNADPHHDKEIGFFVRADLHGQGIATEASTALIAWAKENLEMTCAHASVDPANAPSCAVIEKHGLQQVGGVPAIFVKYKTKDHENVSRLIYKSAQPL